ncbi:MAG: hybrid sensor histidine kinase/response regulator, partial [Chloroflexota bacterium]
MMTKILIVEDSLQLLENTSLELEFRGYEVTQATDGQHALSILRDCDRLPDVVVSDIAMPDMDGYALLEHIRTEPRLYSLPVLFITAFDNKNSVQISKELGVDDYIVKPFDIDELIVAIENKLKRIQAFQRVAEENLDDVRQTLMNMLSHELRTPLMAIYGGSEVLAESLANTPDETVDNVVQLIRRGADRLNRLTGKALALLQIDSGHLKKAFNQSQSTHNLNEIIHTAVKTIESEIVADKRQITIEVSGHAQPLYVTGIFAYMVMMI